MAGVGRHGGERGQKVCRWYTRDLCCRKAVGFNSATCTVNVYGRRLIAVRKEKYTGVSLLMREGGEMQKREKERERDESGLRSEEVVRKKVDA